MLEFVSSLSLRSFVSKSLQIVGHLTKISLVKNPRGILVR